MTPEEKSLLTDFLARLTNAGAVQADPEAAMLIARAAEQQPAALYLTVQRSVWLEHALQDLDQRLKASEARRLGAEEKVRSLQAGQPGLPPTGTAAASPWLSSTWGSGADNGRTPLPPAQAESAAGWMPGLPQQVPAQMPTPNRGGVSPLPPGAAMAANPYPAPGSFGAPGGMFGGGSFLSGGNGMLATIATTAAGVAVGSMIAEAFSGGHHHYRDNLVDSTPMSSEQGFLDQGDSSSLGDFDGGGSSESDSDS